MQLNIAHVCRALVVLALMATTTAAVTVHPLVGDAAAIPGWTGTQSFTGSNASLTATVTSTVDYAVYAPGQFYASNAAHLNLPPGAADPSGGAEFVYAYEVFTDALSNQVSSALSVGIDPGNVFATSTFVNHYSFNPELGLAPF